MSNQLAPVLDAIFGDDSDHDRARAMLAEITPQLAARPVPASYGDGVPVYYLDPHRVLIAPDVFQFKQTNNPRGVTCDLADVRVYDPRLAGISVLYHLPPDKVGTYQICGLEVPGDYALNAHHRVDLAIRAENHPAAIAVQYVDGGNDPTIEPARDGYGRPMRNVSPQDARAFGALMNMAEGHGTAHDMAKFMRDTGTSADRLPSSISLSAEKVATAIGLAALSPYLWDECTRGNIAEPTAATIGRELRNDLEAQNSLYKAIDGRRLSADAIADLIRLAKGAENIDQGSLFGDGFLETSTMADQVKILGHVRDQWNSEARLMGVAARGQSRLESAGDTRIDQPQVSQRAAAARQSVELLEKFAYGAGTATNTAIRQLGAELARNPGNKAEIFNRARTIVADDLARDAAAMGVTL